MEARVPSLSFTHGPSQALIRFMIKLLLMLGPQRLQHAPLRKDLMVFF